MEFCKLQSYTNSWKSYKEVPSMTQESDHICKDLRKRGFKFVGSKICYSMMPAIGMVMIIL